MPGAKRKATPVRRAAGDRAPRAKRPARKVEASAGMLVVIDDGRLKRAAWAQVHTARKRLEKATGDLHRHEEVDEPEYRSWLHRTFPVLITTLRELHDRVLSLTQKIRSAQAQAWITGQSIKRVWRDAKERAENPDAYEKEEDTDADDANEGVPPGGSWDEGDSIRDVPPAPIRTRTAKAIYRRLVQRLHPDAGGAWTAVRERLWHEVQQAWEHGDTDWLARLEMEWETANEILSERSPLSRLYRALEELDAARRDIERRLREYRRSPAWRFSRRESTRHELHERMEAELLGEIGELNRQLRPLDSMVAAWEHDWTRADTRRRRRV